MWNIVFYKRENGKEPVQEFLDELSEKHFAKAIAEIRMLEKHGTQLTMPRARHISGKLWELRIKFSSDISRVFYFIPSGKDIVLLHAFIKKTNKTPANEIKKAQLYMEDWIRRFGNEF